ncbi:MAG: ATP-binding cassette domain-containing protein [Tissierellia bacterium]|nr:ATP-binding cassette domain-containing protein [Tissierellia bacterium]MDD4725727.1 ATP-binding cassette domain-containing protein [Tissierellia bacterium]
MRLDIENIKKTYGDKIVLDISNMTIKEGKITGITGPNGSGKSTLLNIISYIDDNFSGKVKYNGMDFSKEVAKNITYVFQKPYLLRRSVYDNIVYPLKLRKVDNKSQTKYANDIMKRLEIEDLSNKRGQQLSGGESQKVALARALVFKPKLLLLDEPTSNIDSESVKIMEREIVNFNKETSGTVLIVTHNLEQAQRICDEVISLDSGKVRN